MEKILFKKIELWILGVLAVFAFFGMVLFGAIVLDEERGEEELGGDHFGVIGDAALALAELPENARQSLRQLGRPDSTMFAFPRLPGNSSKNSAWDWFQAAGSKGLDGYLLLSRYDGNRSRHIIELVSLSTGEVVHVWTPDAERLLSSFERKPEFDGWAPYERWNKVNFRYIHPYLTTTGAILLKDHHSPLNLVSACGDIIWSQNDQLFHHSTNSDGEGGFWIPSVQLKSRPKDLSKRFVRDAVTRVNAEGEVIFQQSMDIIFENSGLSHLLYPVVTYSQDPMHLNDIEPVFRDGPYWKTGDLFLSFRSPSIVAIYRPSERRLIWWKAGPWLSQHDVDILDDHRIAVFNNNAYNRGLGRRVKGVSYTLIYDFETDTIQPLSKPVLESLDVKTTSEGLQDFSPSGHLVLEEENRGRLFIIDPQGEITATFVNRAKNGYVYRMGWSRYIPQAHGDKALAAIEKSGC